MKRNRKKTSLMEEVEMALEEKEAKPVIAGIDHAAPGSEKTVLAEVAPDHTIRKYAMVEGKKEIPGEGMIKEG